MTNIADRLSDIAERFPDTPAVIQPERTGTYRSITFAELNADTERIAEGLRRFGVQPGMRLALFVRYGIDFISLVFSLCKAEATLVLIDPGMGIRRMFRCLTEINPDGFVAVPSVQIVRLLMRHRFPKAKYNITVGKRWGWDGKTLNELRQTTAAQPLPHGETAADSLAAIIFTSGSTGPAKGVAFTHSIFDTQVREIQKRFNIQSGEVDLACFPFFGLFDAAMGVTAVIPDIDSSKPAAANPAKIVEVANRWNVTQSFASPAIWKRVADYCTKTGAKLGTLKRAVSAGAPVSAEILAKLKPHIHLDGDIFTPYGATESLPVAAISATEVLNETAAKTAQGLGVCVGKRFDTITWKVIKITDEPIARLDDAEELPAEQIGELAVTGPQVTTQYVNRPEADAASKMRDVQGRIWHRIGDTGYLDEQDRFWFCGRKAHRVEANGKTYYSIPCEAVFNQHPKVYRSALAAKKEANVSVRMFIEPYPEHFPNNKKEAEALLAELRTLGQSSTLTADITDIILKRHFPVDVRHNIKINREMLR
ncbi:MAG: AMP-binding protein [Planctomycetaceae bacterium]|nr:AMP-binding protein [Planctomycetaceae bacterium]